VTWRSILLSSPNFKPNSLGFQLVDPADMALFDRFNSHGRNFGLPSKTSSWLGRCFLCTLIIIVFLLDLEFTNVFIDIISTTTP
jgi:hypothetical protein